MILKTDGIVIHTLKYGETSIIARIFTSKMGMQSYLARGVRTSKSAHKQLLFQPLTLVSMVAYHKDSDGLKNIKEIGFLETFQTIPYQIHKTSLAIFLAEVLSHSLKNQEANNELFDFVRDALLFLDRTKGPVTSFHLVFLLQLSRFLGFQPRNNHDKHNRYFNLQEGMYQHIAENDETCLDKALSRTFSKVAATELTDLESLSVPKDQRKALLNRTIDYYRYHLAGMPALKSHTVLEAVFAE